MLTCSVRVAPFVFFITFLLCSQVLHSNPRWPTDAEFLSVNKTVGSACQRYPNVEESFVWSLIWEENKYNPLALGSKDEIGLGQLMPATANGLGVRDRPNVPESVETWVRHLSYLLRKYRNDTRLVLAAYNSGEPIVDRCHCVPAASRAYVSRIEQNRLFAKRAVSH
jgi:soluble lytic murein transglycosylase-like protein